MADPTAEEIAGAVERAYRRIAVGMAELPICNPALTVEAVGFRRFAGEWLGVLVTPWTISLLLAPAGAESALRRLGVDDQQRWRFPSGDYEFLPGDQPEIGVYQTCSLLSPTGGVGSQDEARALSLAALEALLQGEAAPTPGAAAESPSTTAEPPPPPAPAPPPSRRAFLSLGRRR